MMERKIVINIYEPPMCCTSGVCGPAPDKKLMDLQDNIKRIEKEFPGVKINRYSMNFNPLDFSKNREVLTKVKTHRTEILPIITINDVIVKEKGYLSYTEMVEQIKAL